MQRAWGAMPTARARGSTGCSSRPSPLPEPAGGAIATEGAIAGRSTLARAWTEFWQEQGCESRCLANVHPDVRRSLSGHWRAFAATLAPSARILDIGCGAGIVGRTMLAAHGGFRIAGVDLADVPAPGDRRIALLPATPMEDLPFAAGSFEAAVSQFGFEYGDRPRAARELARVLVPGAPLSLIVHHASSSIVEKGLARSRALAGLLDDPVRRPFLAANAAGLEQAIRSIRRDAPGEPIVGEVAQALRGRLGRGEAQRAAIWNAVAAALAPERAILGALAACCVAPADLDRWLAAFAGRFDIRAASPMHRPTGEVIAWKIDGVRLPAAGR